MGCQHLFHAPATYGRYLNFLKRHQLLLANEGPADRATPDRLTLYLTEIKQLLAPRSIQQALVDLRLMMKAIVPEKDWNWITRHPARPSVRDVRDYRGTTSVFDPMEVCNRAMDVMDHIGTGAIKFAVRIEYRNA